MKPVNTGCLKHVMIKRFWSCVEINNKRFFIVHLSLSNTVPYKIILSGIF